MNKTKICLCAFFAAALSVSFSYAQDFQEIPFSDSAASYENMDPSQMERLIDAYDKNFKEMGKTMTREEKDEFNRKLSSMLAEAEKKNKAYIDNLSPEEKAEYDVKVRQKLETLKLK